MVRKIDCQLTEKKNDQRIKEGQQKKDKQPICNNKLQGFQEMVFFISCANTGMTYKLPCQAATNNYIETESLILTLETVAVSPQGPIGGCSGAFDCIIRSCR